MLRKNLLNKTIAVAVAAGLLLSSTPVFADNPMGYPAQPDMAGRQNNRFGQLQFNWNALGMNQQNTKPADNSQVNNTSNMNMPQDRMNSVRQDLFFNYLEFIAEKLDIETTDMTNGELAEAIIDQLDELTDEKLDSLAKVFFINTDSMEENAIIEAIEGKIDDLLLDENLADAVDLMDISASGMSHDKAAAAVIDGLDDASLEEVMRISGMLRISVSGLTYGGVIDEIEEALGELN